MMAMAVEQTSTQRAVRRVISSLRRLSPVTEEMGRSIVAGTLAAGTTLNERTFGEARSVSRTSFREAIKVLESKGLVRSKQYTGTQVMPRTSWHLLDPHVLAWRIATGSVGGFLKGFFEFRRVIEPSATEACARQHDREQIGSIREAFEEMARLEAHDPFGERYVEADMRFHRAIFTASGNEFLASLGYILEVPMLFSFTLHASLEVGPSNRLALHEEVVQQIEAGNPRKAHDASLALLEDVAFDVARILEHENA